jgi:serine phosphatase RsbU (regulator of sigma subunit)
VLGAAGETKHVLRATSPPLGLFESPVFPAGEEVALARGDLLLLLTDGAAEAESRDGAFFETARVLEVVRSARHEDAARVVRRLHAAIRAFAPDVPQRDDITVVVGRVVG